MSDAGTAPIRVIPQRRTRAQIAEAPAKLVATLLSVATAGLLDAGRFRRGREYASNGAVTELVVARGTLHGTVHGSRREPYSVEVHTGVVAAPAGGSGNVQALISVVPDAGELHALCTCPDGAESVCKHAAAVLLAFAEEAGARPELLVAWRCTDDPTAARATIGSRLGRAAASSQPAAAAGVGANAAPDDRRPDNVRVGAFGSGRRADSGRGGPPSPFETPAWVEFVDFPAELPPIDELIARLSTAAAGDDGTGRPAVAALGSERVGAFDLSAMVRSAQQAMRAAGHDIV